MEIKAKKNTLKNEIKMRALKNKAEAAAVQLKVFEFKPCWILIFRSQNFIF